MRYIKKYWRRLRPTFELEQRYNMIMRAVAEDYEAVKALWALQYDKAGAVSLPLFKDLYALQDIFIAKHEGEVIGLLIKTDIEYDGRKGVYFCAAAVMAQHRGKGVMRQIYEFAQKELQSENVQFAVSVPACAGRAEMWQNFGFEPAFEVRRFEVPIKKNLLAVAQPDTMTSKNLNTLNEKFLKSGAITFSSKASIAMVMQLYTNGGSCIESEKAFGVYYKRGETLVFVQLFAASEHDAQYLLSAAREITGLSTAEVTIEAQADLYYGHGKAQAYGGFKYYGGANFKMPAYFNTLNQ